jgi:hypothetical protein
MAFRSKNLNFLLLQIAKFSTETQNIDLMCLINTLILLELSKIDYLWIACFIGGNFGILQHRFSLNDRLFNLIIFLMLNVPVEEGGDTGVVELPAG